MSLFLSHLFVTFCCLVSFESLVRVLVVVYLFLKFGVFLCVNDYILLSECMFWFYCVFMFVLLHGAEWINEC